MTSAARSVQAPDELDAVWAGGFSIAELWGFSSPVARATSEVDGAHQLLWGILGMVEYQVDRGAGHRYLRDRLWSGDWVAVGFKEPRAPSIGLSVVPRIEEAKFGRKHSVVGDGSSHYADVRVVHARFLTDFGAAGV